ncbi:uncharacterized protein FIBRA_06524 [Fibroporia radiculosa]|uniref:Uncharacterized protein n=1 Tax=Fibroporia radiculosa TaxID=599839 RepID=J4HZ90_9APHY|nr:uncharacterized protein FIBRA_06524 [Fibroporia radiculosa]CCM04352.1 predicted protein [Fibroporia radiculosa]
MDSGTSTLASSLGAIFLGNIVTATCDAISVVGVWWLSLLVWSFSFFGLTTIQTYIYCKCPKDDSFVMQALIFVLWVIDGLHLAFSTHTVYSYTILDYANLKEPQDVVWSLPAMVLVTGMSDLIVRSLFCYRVWKLSKKTSDWSLVVAIILTSIVTVAASWVYAFEAFTVKTLGELSWPVFSQLLYAGLVSALVGDIIIAGSLCILLTSHCTGLSTYLLYSCGDDYQLTLWNGLAEPTLSSGL